MLYLHEVVTAQPGMIDEYLDIAFPKYLLPGWTRYISIVGIFKNACHINEMLALWELGQEAGSIDSLGSYVFVDRDGMAWHRLADKYRQDWYDSWLESAPFSPTVATIEDRQQRGDFIGCALYYWELTRILPGKMDEYLEAMEKELIPMEKRRGMNLAGCYRWFGACGDPSEIRSLWAVKDWAHWGHMREARAKDPAFQQWTEKASAWRTEWSYKFWAPTQSSLLK